jgi:hypothetical protein
MVVGEGRGVGHGVWLQLLPFVFTLAQSLTENFRLCNYIV